MNSRRKFLQQAAALSVGGALLSNSSWANNFSAKIKLPAPGIQLFTVLREMDTDAVGTLQKLADAGYKNIESAFNKNSFGPEKESYSVKTPNNDFYKAV